MCEDTNLKAIHNSVLVTEVRALLSSMCEDTKLKIM